MWVLVSSGIAPLLMRHGCHVCTLLCTAISRTNGKEECKRVYIREEKLLRPLIGCFDHTALNEEQIEAITQYVKEIHQLASIFHNESLGALRKEQDRIQLRISQIYEES